MHGLSTLIPLGVLPSPIHHPHLHKVVQDSIGKDHRIMGTELFDNADGISPQMIVEVTFIEDIVDPTLLAETLLSWKDRSIQYPGINLTYHQPSTQSGEVSDSTSLKPGYSPTVELAGCG